jgi:hypothetical protein
LALASYQLTQKESECEKKDQQLAALREKLDEEIRHKQEKLCIASELGARID